MSIDKIVLKLGENKLGYVYLPDHPGRLSFGCVVRQLRLCELIENYSGPDIHLDFDKNDKLIGIEIDDE